MVGGIAKIDAGMSYRASAGKYRECLMANPNPSACDRERLIMEADERALKTTAAAYDGSAASVDATYRPR